MKTQIFRSITEPKRECLSWEEKWKDFDRGLLICWEVGRDRRAANPELATKAEMGELPILEWKGGVEKALKKKEKFGSLNYLAQWQGLRGEDLNINVSEETKLTCSRTGMTVIYTPDLSLYLQP